MSVITLLHGSRALSDFRVSNLLNKITSHHPNVQGVQSRFVHYVWSDATLSEQDLAILNGLLAYGEEHQSNTFDEVTMTVVPRIGTISPWASKATDIAHNAGLTHIRRIERGIEYGLVLNKGLLGGKKSLSEDDLAQIAAEMHDRMTESWFVGEYDGHELFLELPNQPLQTIPLLKNGKSALAEANIELGLALSDDEMDYLVDAYQKAQRDPTDVELMMFAQANSEHCRHKIFNADFIIDGEAQPMSLFKMIRNTRQLHSEGDVVA